MVGPRPFGPARWLLAVTVMVLPAATRDRYREELRTELSDLGWGPQVFQAGSLLVGSMALRNALSGRELPDSLPTTRDWRCRLGRHRYVGRVDDNPEMRGGRYLQCVRCGKKKDPPRYGPMPPLAIGRGA